MFDLNLDGATVVSAEVWGNVVALVRLSFRCFCSVEGYHDRGAFLVTGGRPCMAHKPEGRQAIAAGFQAPNPDPAPDFFDRWVETAWEQGYQAGFHEGTDRTVMVLATVRPAGSGSALGDLA